MCHKEQGKDEPISSDVCTSVSSGKMKATLSVTVQIKRESSKHGLIRCPKGSPFEKIND